MADQSPDERLYRRAVVMRTLWLTVAGLCVVARVVPLVAAITAGEGSAAIGVGILLLLLAVPTLLTNVRIMRRVRAERAAGALRTDSSNSVVSPPAGGAGCRASCKSAHQEDHA